MISLLMIINLIINVIWFLVLIQFIMSLLIAFDVLNRRQPVVMQIYSGVSQILDPILAPIRRLLPPSGGIDFSPMVLLIGLYILQIVIANNLRALA